MASPGPSASSRADSGARRSSHSTSDRDHHSRRRRSSRSRSPERDSDRRSKHRDHDRNRDRDGDRDRGEDGHPPSGVDELHDEDDYFRKATELKLWLWEEKHKVRSQSWHSGGELRH